MVTKAERAFMSRVAELGCMICKRPAQLHHPTGAGWGLRSSHMDVIPLCFDHHSEQTTLPFGYSVHKGTKSFEARFGTQEELLVKRDELLGG